MRAVLSVLCVFVLVLAANAANPTLAPGLPELTDDCSGAGFKASANCLCLSGHAGADCSQNATNTCAFKVASNIHEHFYPTLDMTSAKFQSNKLVLAFNSPYVGQRHISNVTMKDSSDPMCALGEASSLWTQSLNDAACSDRFSFEMPWRTMHAGCGFVPHANPDALVTQYKGTIVVTYNDVVPIDMEDTTVAIARKAIVTFDVYVNFPTFVDVDANLVLINSTVNVLYYLTKTEYDQATDMMDVEVSTVINWPNTLIADGAYLAVPTGITASNMAITTCDASQQNKPCMQKFSAKIQTNSCTFDGVYIFNASTITCRDSNDCTAATAVMVFNIHTSDICGHVQAEPTLSATLEAYLDQARTQPMAFGTVGTNGYFYTHLSNEDNTVSVQHVDITFEVDGDTSSRKYLLQSGVANPTYVGKMSLNVQDGSRWFSVFFHSNVFGIQPQETKSYIFRVTVAISYLGNENEHKRSIVEQTFKTPGGFAAAHTQVGMQASPEAVAAYNARTSSNVQVYSIHTLVVAVVGTVCSVLVVAAAVVLVVGNKQKRMGYSRI